MTKNRCASHIMFNMFNDELTTIELSESPGVGLNINGTNTTNTPELDDNIDIELIAITQEVLEKNEGDSCRVNNG